jgi:hypothetical protein
MQLLLLSDFCYRKHKIFINLYAHGKHAVLSPELSRSCVGSVVSEHEIFHKWNLYLLLNITLYLNPRIHLGILFQILQFPIRQQYVVS